MSCENVQDFCVQTGTTWHPTVRWGTGVLTCRPVQALTQGAPISITANNHGLPNGWPAALSGVQGMTQANAENYPPEGDDLHTGYVVDTNTVQFNDVDSSNFSAYTTGGYLVYDTPQNMAGFSLSLGIYADAAYSMLLTTLTSAGAQITVDNTLKTITPLLQTAGLTWSTGYYRLDATDGGGIVTELMRGVINIE